MRRIGRSYEATWWPVEPNPPREVWLLALLDERLPLLLLLPERADDDDDHHPPPGVVRRPPA